MRRSGLWGLMESAGDGGWARGAADEGAATVVSVEVEGAPGALRARAACHSVWLPVTAAAPCTDGMVKACF